MSISLPSFLAILADAVSFTLLCQMTTLMLRLSARTRERIIALGLSMAMGGWILCAFCARLPPLHNSLRQDLASAYLPLLTLSVLFFFCFIAAITKQWKANVGVWFLLGFGALLFISTMLLRQHFYAELTPLPQGNFTLRYRLAGQLVLGLLCCYTLAALALLWTFQEQRLRWMLSGLCYAASLLLSTLAYHNYALAEVCAALSFTLSGAALLRLYGFGENAKGNTNTTPTQLVQRFESQQHLLELLTSSSASHTTLQKLARYCQQLDERAGAVILQWHPLQKETSIEGSAGLSSRFLQAFIDLPPEVQHHLFRLIWSEAHLSVFKDIQVDMDWGPLAKAAQDAKRHAAWCIPLTSQNEKLGMLCLFHRTARRPVLLEQEGLEKAAQVASQLIERQIHEQELQAGRERYMLLGLGAQDVLWDWDIEKDLLSLSPRWRNLLGWSEVADNATLDAWLDRVHPADRKKLREAIAQHIQGMTPHLEHRHRLRHKEGRDLWVLCRGYASRNPKGEPIRLAGSFTDITPQLSIQDQLLNEAFHDPLTGLGNRAQFHKHLEYALNKSQRSIDPPFAVLYLGLDRFKSINEGLGFAVGDQMLALVSARLRLCIRPGDTIARMGGDEFAILLENLSENNDVNQIVDRIQKHLSQPFDLSNRSLYTSASIGVTFSRERYDDPESLLRDAGIAMDRAKKLGRSCHSFFDTEMRIEAITQQQREHDLRAAIEGGQFRLYYQPIVSLKTGHLHGFESLLRWKHPELGMVSPAAIIPLAEETGLIHRIGSWCLHEACRQLVDWQMQYTGLEQLRVTINLSAKQLLEPSLVDQVHQTIKETGINPSCLGLEITESTLIENLEQAIDTLKKLRRLGILLYADDFGTGYSSLSYLSELPLHVLKIDRSFVSEMHLDSGKVEIVRTVLNLGRKLALQVVAEGIEESEERELLTTFSCEYGQGYLFSRPLNPSALGPFLMARSRDLPFSASEGELPSPASLASPGF